MKALVILVLAAAIFGAAYYAVWFLYLKPAAAIQAEKLAPPPPPPPDPSLPEFQRVMKLQSAGDTLAERAGWQDFIERYVRSTKLDEAKERLGQINVSLFLSPVLTPEKTVYTVARGDVIGKVANRSKSTPELIMRSNNLSGSMLRIGQKLIIPPADFSLVINRAERKVVLLEKQKFFKQYPIAVLPEHRPSAAEKKAPSKPIKLVAHVADKIAWYNGSRVSFAEKKFQNFLEATHWILISPGNHNLYTEMETPPGGTPLQKPPGGGYGLSPESLRELSAFIRKNDAVTIE